MKKLNVIYGCLIFALLVSMCSCGARKVQKESSKEEIKTEVVDNSVIEKQTDTNVKTTTTVKVDDRNETVTEETEYTPQDASKESFVIEKDGTKVILNNTKKIVRKTTQKNNTLSESKQHVNSDIKSNIKEQKEVKQSSASKKENNSKQIYKKAFSPAKSIIIVFIMILVLYVIYRIYKKLPLLPKF